MKYTSISNDTTENIKIVNEEYRRMLEDACKVVTHVPPFISEALKDSCMTDYHDLKDVMKSLMTEIQKLEDIEFNSNENPEVKNISRRIREHAEQDHYLRTMSSAAFSTYSLVGVQAVSDLIAYCEASRTQASDEVVELFRKKIQIMGRELKVIDLLDVDRGIDSLFYSELDKNISDLYLVLGKTKALLELIKYEAIGLGIEID